MLKLWLYQPETVDDNWLYCDYSNRNTCSAQWVSFETKGLTCQAIRIFSWLAMAALLLHFGKVYVKKVMKRLLGKNKIKWKVHPTHFNRCIETYLSQGLCCYDPLSESTTLTSIYCPLWQATRLSWRLPSFMTSLSPTWQCSYLVIGWWSPSTEIYILHSQKPSHH